MKRPRAEESANDDSRHHTVAPPPLVGASLTAFLTLPRTPQATNRHTSNGQVATLPANDASATGAAWGLHPALIARLAELGVASFFPVQRAVVPLLLRGDAGGNPVLGDVCVTAPTGSGKTLAYGLPLADAALRRAERSGGYPGLCALVIVPTRDLAAQVATVLSALVKPVLRVAVATGESPFPAETVALRTAAILVATPGRLVEHLDAEPGLLDVVSHVVIDEADRLLSEGFQAWPARLAVALGTGKGATVERIGGIGAWGDGGLGAALGAASRSTETRAPHTSTLGEPPSWLASAARQQLSVVGGCQHSMRPVIRKVVCSATLTNNPRKLASLNLHAPQYVSADGAGSLDAGGHDDESSSSGESIDASASDAADDAAATEGVAGAAADAKAAVAAAAPTRPSATAAVAAYALPSSLHQAYAVVGAGDKPAVLLQLLRALCSVVDSEKRDGGVMRVAALVFTNSVDAALKLAALVQSAAITSRAVVGLTSAATRAERQAVLARMAAGTVSVVVSSDMAARGLDVPGLAAVLHYDAPAQARTYVHRVGRTARAGAAGYSFALVTPGQMRHFKLMLAECRAERRILREAVDPRAVAEGAAEVTALVGALRGGGDSAS